MISQLDKQLWVEITLRDKTYALELVGNALKHTAIKIMLQYPIDHPNFAEDDLHVFGHHLVRLPLQLVEKLLLFDSHLFSEVGIETWVFVTHRCHN